MSVALNTFGTQDAKETARYCALFDTCFDCLNVRNLSEHIIKRKPFLKPFTTLDDERFQWLEETFLKYLLDWQDSINNCEGEF